jgi:hypothetical protein
MSYGCCRHHYFLANNFTDLSLDSACGSQSNGLSHLPNLGNWIAIDDAAARQEIFQQFLAKLPSAIAIRVLICKLLTQRILP